MVLTTAFRRKNSRKKLVIYFPITLCSAPWLWVYQERKMVSNYRIIRRKPQKGLLNLKWLRLQFCKKTAEKNLVIYFLITLSQALWHWVR
jgi:hypothetical protein